MSSKKHSMWILCQVVVQLSIIVGFLEAQNPPPTSIPDECNSMNTAAKHLKNSLKLIIGKHVQCKPNQHCTGVTCNWSGGGFLEIDLHHCQTPVYYHLLLKYPGVIDSPKNINVTQGHEQELYKEKITTVKIKVTKLERTDNRVTTTVILETCVPGVCLPRKLIDNKTFCVRMQNCPGFNASAHHYTPCGYKPTSPATKQPTSTTSASTGPHTKQSSSASTGPHTKQPTSASTGPHTKQSSSASTGPDTKQPSSTTGASTGPHTKQPTSASTGLHTKQPTSASTGPHTKQPTSASTGPHTKQPTSASTGPHTKQPTSASTGPHTKQPTSASTGPHTEQPTSASTDPHTKQLQVASTAGHIKTKPSPHQYNSSTVSPSDGTILHRKGGEGDNIKGLSTAAIIGICAAAVVAILVVVGVVVYWTKYRHRSRLRAAYYNDISMEEPLYNDFGPEIA